jgi:hypothetical protein
MKRKSSKKVAVKPNGGHELGKTYFCAYWRKSYTVLQIHDKSGWMDWAVTVKWEDGSQTTHCTALDKRDYEVAV